MHYSPLRYPGGKGKLAPFMSSIIENLNLQGGVYIEPFAGGAGIALDLLFNNIVSEIVINDLDKGIYSFWRAIISEPDRFIDKIYSTPVNIKEWKKQKAFLMGNYNKYSFELGFATFYLNRTNRSGIIKGGVIGGISQDGKWKLDARFNKEELVKRIERVAEYKKNIHVYNKDITSFLLSYVRKYEKNGFIYFDPPYFTKGKQLYLNFFNNADHKRIENVIRNSVNCDWVITYDDVPEIAQIYNGYEVRKFDLRYCAASKRQASEIIIFKDVQMIPSNDVLDKRNVKINLR